MSTFFLALRRGQLNCRIVSHGLWEVRLLSSFILKYVSLLVAYVNNNNVFILRIDFYFKNILNSNSMNYFLFPFKCLIHLSSFIVWQNLKTDFCFIAWSVFPRIRKNKYCLLTSEKKKNVINYANYCFCSV